MKPGNLTPEGVERLLERGLAARRLLVHVLEMRAAQKAYFKKRTDENLHQARRLEKIVDDTLETLRRKD